MKQKDVNYVLNLQLFADLNTQTTGSGGLSAENKVYYDKNLIRVAGPELVHHKFASHKPIPRNGGKSIEFRKYDNLKPATTPLVEGVTPKGNSMNVSTVTATVDQYGDYITLSDMLILTAIDNNVVEATTLLGAQAGLTLDCIARDAICGGTNVIYAGGVLSRSELTAESKVDRKIFFKAAAFLKKMHAPKIEGAYVGIVHPDIEEDILTCEGFVDVAKYKNPEKIWDGEIGKIAGIRFVVSSNEKIWKGAEDNCPDGLAVYGIPIFGANAFGDTDIEGGGLETIIKQLGSGEDPLNQRATAGWKATYVAERLVEQYMVRIEACASESANAEAN